MPAAGQYFDIADTSVLLDDEAYRHFSLKAPPFGPFRVKMQFLYRFYQGLPVVQSLCF